MAPTRTIGAVVALTASDVAVAAVAGVSGVRLAVLAAAGAVFATAYLITPAPGRCHYACRDLHPVIAMMAAVVVAIGVTGGTASAMLALLPAPLLVGWTMFRGSRESRILAALVPLALLAIVATPEPWTGPRLDRAGASTLAVWSTLLSAWIIGRRIHRLFEALRSTSTNLDRVRNGALSDADSRRRGLESLTTKLAHELKNPLSAIKSLIQLELRGDITDKTRRRLDVAFAESERMHHILRDYLAFARPVDAMHVAELELGELVSEVGTLLAGRAEEAGVELSLAGRGGVVRADARLLKEALINVASNAVEATPRGGSVEVHYDVDPRRASIVITDTGIGMTAEVSTRVGTPFFTTREGGTGLGVVIARSALAQHRGTLEYTSTPGAGTVATLAFPLAAAVGP